MMTFTVVKDSEKMAIHSNFGAWHVRHGWAYNVFASSGECIGMFYVTLLPGVAGFIHFDVNAAFSPLMVVGGFRQAIRIASRQFPLLFASVKRENVKLIAILVNLGFAHHNVGTHQPYAVLQYLKPENDIVVLNNN